MHGIQVCQCEACSALGCMYAHQSTQGDMSTDIRIVVLGIRLKRREKVLQEVMQMLRCIGEVKGEPFTSPTLGLKVVVFASVCTTMDVEEALQLFNRHHHPVRADLAQPQKPQGGNHPYLPYRGGVFNEKNNAVIRKSKQRRSNKTHKKKR